MEICVDFDEQRLRKYDKGGMPAYFSLWWRYGDKDYPVPEYGDFGGWALLSWMYAAINLLQGSVEEKLTYYDQDHSITVTREGDNLIFSALELIESVELLFVSKDEQILFTCSLQGYISILLNAANRVIEEFKRLDVHPREQIGLLEAEEKLNQAMAVRFNDTDRTGINRSQRIR